MKKKFLFVALSALALTACVNDETIEVNPGDALTFRATSGNATKSQITTTLNISDFKVWGYHQSAAEPSVTTPFMEDQLVQRISGVWTYSPTRFWPESGTIDFFSVSPYETPGISITKTEQKIEDYTVNTNISLQKDLLYAVNMGCSKAANGQTGVEVNFRHALSQIVFQAKNTNSNIKVDIEGVKVVNVVSKGTFTYPQETTSPNLTGTNHDTEYDDTWGTWDLSSTTGDVVTYEAGVTERTGITPSSEEVALTTVGGGELLLLPQTLSEWVPSTGESGTGSRFLINCKIWNVSGDDEVLLWPGKNEYSACVGRLVHVLSVGHAPRANGTFAYTRAAQTACIWVNLRPVAHRYRPESTPFGTHSATCAEVFIQLQRKIICLVHFFYLSFQIKTTIFFINE